MRSSLPVLLSNGLIPLHWKTTGFPANAESRVDPKQGNEGGIWEPSPGIMSVSMPGSCCLFFALTLLPPKSVAWSWAWGDSVHRDHRMHSRGLLPPHQLSSPCPTHLLVGRRQHGSDSRGKIPAPLKSDANILTVRETRIHSTFSPKHKV